LDEQRQRERRRLSGEASQADRSGGAERGLRGLVGAGPTQVDVTAAMRARDASRPSAEELATAEAELVVVRRNWQPRDWPPPLRRS